jgi:hypothetical protein
MRMLKNCKIYILYIYKKKNKLYFFFFGFTEKILWFEESKDFIILY